MSEGSKNNPDNRQGPQTTEKWIRVGKKMCKIVLKTSESGLVGRILVDKHGHFVEKYEG